MTPSENRRRLDALRAGEKTRCCRCGGRGICQACYRNAKQRGYQNKTKEAALSLLLQHPKEATI